MLQSPTVRGALPGEGEPPGRPGADRGPVPWPPAPGSRIDHQRRRAPRIGAPLGLSGGLRATHEAPPGSAVRRPTKTRLRPRIRVHGHQHRSKRDRSRLPLAPGAAIPRGREPFETAGSSTGTGTRSKARRSSRPIRSLKDRVAAKSRPTSRRPVRSTRSELSSDLIQQLVLPSRPPIGRRASIAGQVLSPLGWAPKSDGRADYDRQTGVRCNVSAGRRENLESSLPGSGGSVSREGFEPSTKGLKVPCSTAELPARRGPYHVRIEPSGALFRAGMECRHHPGPSQPGASGTVRTVFAAPFGLLPNDQGVEPTCEAHPSSCARPGSDPC